MLLLFACGNHVTTEDLLNGNFDAVDKVPPHSLVISEPIDGAINLYSESPTDKIFMRGSASDDRQLDRIELSFDNGPFQVIQGTDIWQYEFSSYDLQSSRGIADKKVIVRAYDQNNNFTEASITIGTSHPLYVTKGTNAADTNDGTIASPLLTINEAATRATLEGVKTIYVAGYTDANSVPAKQYQESVYINSGVHLLGGYNETFTARDWKTNISYIYGNNIVRRNGINISSTAHDDTIIIEGFSISTNSPDGDCNEWKGIYIGSSDILIKHNKIYAGKNNISPCSGSSARVYAIYINAKDDIIIENNYISAENGNVISATLRAINANNVLIKNNILESLTSEQSTGIQLDSYSKAKVFNNIIRVDSGTTLSNVITTIGGSRSFFVNNILIGSNEANSACFNIPKDTSYLWVRAPYYFQNNLLAHCPLLFYDAETDFNNTVPGPANTIDYLTGLFDPTLQTDIDNMTLNTTSGLNEKLNINDVTGNLCLSGENPCDITGSLDLIFTTATPSVPNDYILNPTSKAIDAGLSSYDYGSFKLEDTIIEDFDGTSRGYDDASSADYDIGAFDIGPFEYMP